MRRCKERRRLMKEAVHARHHLAAAHADYIRSLRHTGSALYTFAKGEPLSVSHETPAVFLHTSHTTNHIPPRVHSTSPPPPPSPPLFSPSPSPTIPSSNLPHIVSDSQTSSRRKTTAKVAKRRQPKLPHILSESSLASSTPRSQSFGNFYPTAYQANSTYSSTPSQSQASSVWNWENYYPPSPPDSEFFHQRSQSLGGNHRNQHLDPEYDEEAEHQEEEEEEEGGGGQEPEKSEYDFFEKKTENHWKYPEPATETTTEQREEVQCSEWEDHYTSTSSSDDEEEGEEARGHDDRDLRSEIGTRSNFGSSVRAESVAELPRKYPMRSEKSEDAASSSSYRNGEISDLKLVVRHKNLKEIVEAIKEYFEKEAESGNQVSSILEIGRAQLDRSFRQLKSKFK